VQKPGGAETVTVVQKPGGAETVTVVQNAVKTVKSRQSTFSKWTLSAF
jgi:hypothetical protein